MGLVARCVRLRRALESVGRATLAALDGGALVERALSGSREERVNVWAVGKAARAMARGARHALDGKIVRELIVEKKMADVGIDAQVIAAGHPLPDEQSVAA